MAVEEVAGGGVGEAEGVVLQRVDASRDLARSARQRRQAAARAVGRLRRRFWLRRLAGWAVATTALTTAALAFLGASLAAEVFFVVTSIAVVVMPFFFLDASPQRLLQRQLREGGQDVALATSHLSPALASLLESTRLLRLTIEVAPPDDVDAVRATWAWIRQVQRLSPVDRAVIEQLGLSGAGVEGALLGDVEAEGEVSGAGEGAARAQARRRRNDVIAEQLEGFEAALLRHDPGPYR
mgnify:CR=1 FL=1